MCPIKSCFLRRWSVVFCFYFFSYDTKSFNNFVTLLGKIAVT